MVNYQNGKIYKIVCNKTGLIYIGSTCENLSNRLANHRRTYKHYLLTQKYAYLASYDILKNDDYSIVLIEDYPCENKEQLLSRERYFIDLMSCTNKTIPTRTTKEWREDNKERIKQFKKDKADIIKEQMRIYRQKNRDIIREQAKIYRQMNREKYNEQKKKYNEENKDKIKNYKSRCDKFTCECGSHLFVNNKSNHIKSKKHILFIKNQEKNI